MILASIIMMGCKGGNVTEQLEQIDSLLVHDKVDSALVRLSELRITNSNQADSAYFILLRTEARNRLSMLTQEDSCINFCVNYYERTSDNEKNARAYYYKGVTSYYLTKNLAASILLAKQAERYAEKTDNQLLKHKIYEILAFYNSRAYENKLSLSYDKKALQIAKRLNDKNRQAIAFIGMAGSYHSLGYMDSLAICIQECLPLTDYIRETDKAYLYTRIGEFYAESEPEMAKKYLLKAIDIYPQLWTYLALSNIYLKENNQEKAQEIWTKALQTKGTTKAKIDILKADSAK
jgi:tetratricopeptide (TPR) repeat protein